MPSDLLDQVRAVAAKSTAATEREYAALVRRCAAGRDAPSPEEVVEFLDRTGRDLDQFQGAVERLAGRIEAAATFATLPRAAADREKAAAALVATSAAAAAELRAALADLEARRVAAVAAADRKTAAARAAADAAAGVVCDCEAARRLLVETAPPEICERLAALAAERLGLEARAREREGALKSRDVMEWQTRDARAALAAAADRLPEIAAARAKLEEAALTP